MKKIKRNDLTLFEYADKALSKLTDEDKDRVRRYLNYKFKKLRAANSKSDWEKRVNYKYKDNPDEKK